MASSSENPSDHSLVPAKDEHSDAKIRKIDSFGQAEDPPGSSDAQTLTQNYGKIDAKAFAGYAHNVIIHNTITGVGLDVGKLGDPSRVYENLKEQELHFVRRLPSGRMGQVDLCVWKKNAGKLVARKSLLQGNFTEYKANLMSEISILLGIQHQNIVPALGYVYTENTVALVMEYYKYGSYQDCFVEGNLAQTRNDGEHTILSPLKLRILSEVILAMQHIHSKGILHRDLKGKNVLLDDDLHAKVCDFGLSSMKTITRLSRQSSIANASGSAKGTLLFMAPEHLSDPRYRAGSPTDVYAFGILAWQILTDREPYVDDFEGNEDLILHNVRVSDLRPDVGLVPSCTHDVVKDMVTTCWDKNPEKRLSFQEMGQTIQALIASEDGWEESVKQAEEFAKTLIKIPQEDSAAIADAMPQVEWRKVREALQQRGGTSHLNYGGFNITCETDYYFHKFQLKWKCLCIDETTGRRAKAKGYQSGFGAGEHAASKLIREMISEGIYPRPVDEELLKKD